VATDTLPRIVIIGAGFGGIQAALSLNKAEAQITVIDRWNHHLFQPLLYQVATAGLSPADIATPVRTILRKQKNTVVLMEEVTGIDRKSHEVVTQKMRIPYDYLIVATGAETSYFGHDDWEMYAHGLKSIDDARLIREEILRAFEDAEEEPDAEKRKQLLTFVVIGGGPTGVEMAGAIAELAHHVLREEFRRIDPESTRIILIEGAPRILGTFDESLSSHAMEDLRKLGVEVRTQKKVTAIDEHSVTIGDERIAAATVVWAAGVRASKAAQWLRASSDKSGKVNVTPSLHLDDDENIFVIGDTANVLDKDGKSLPGLSPVAMQQGRYVAKVILSRIQGESNLKAFRYRDKGVMATIGRSRAIAQIGRFKFTGFLAWFLWTFVHILYLIGFRNRFIVMFEWIWAYFTYQRGVRIITSDTQSKTTVQRPSSSSA
jgi:NADH:ubiquinone reductase (H+-translocating)